MVECQHTHSGLSLPGPSHNPELGCAPGYQYSQSTAPMRYCTFESAHYLAAVAMEDYLGNKHEFIFVYFSF